MAADNWGFILAAYGLAAVVLFTYLRRLVRRERELDNEPSRAPQAGSGVRSQAASLSGHPRSEPGSRAPRQ